MNHQIFPRVEDHVQRYQAEHKGERPLYMLMPAEEADDLMNELRTDNGYDSDVIVTEFNGIKIVKNESLRHGEIRLTNELPETSS